MRIAYVTTDRGIEVFGAKGASIHIQQMVRAFRGLGHEVEVFAAAAGDAPQGWQVEEIARPGTQGSSRAEKERAAIVQAERIEARLVRRHREAPFGMIYERYALWSAAGVRASARLGIPCVLEVNAPLRAEQAEHRSLALAEEAAALEAETLRGATWCAAVSEEVATFCRAVGAKRVTVIGNAVDTGAFHPGIIGSAPVPDGAFTVGFTGSLKRWHGVDTLLEAFRRLHLVRPNAHLLVVGDGPKRGWIEGFVAGAGLGEAVTLTGWTDHAALPPLIARMDVATAPYPAAEGHYFSPLKLYEYLAMGRPVVASRIGQTAALLEGHPAGVLLPPGDAPALAETLIALHDDPDRRDAMACAAAREGRRHDWSRNAGQVLDLVAAEDRVDA